MQSKAEIAQLVNDWAFFRDRGSWDELLATFHTEGTISISWMDGPFATFVAASRLAAGNDSLALKHNVGVPRIELNADRATSEVNVTIMLRADLDAGLFDVTAHARFYDLVEKRDGTWRILSRTAIYERDRIDPVDRPSVPDEIFRGLDAFPVELRFLGSTLGRFGVSTSPTTVLDRTERSRKLYADGAAWLSGR